ncbi:peptidase S24/S26A/S26B/S26C [Morchella snyderi]|nr:peptidase S24/S26A/S26B/S26C [Morchella snyderi]
MNRFFSASRNSRFARLFEFHPPEPRAIARFTVRFIQGCLFTHLFWVHFYAVGYTVGASMLPTINILGDGIVISKLHTRGRGVEVGDIVTYLHPVYASSGERVVKRIIGMPGDFVVADPIGAPGKMVQVPEGHCWTTGDNLPYSRDSRGYGPVPLALIRGKIIARLYPNRKWFENTLKPVEEY